ncbi:hypothetical protein GDO86_013728 [Hymenochirus boettgeri]|uniref:Uncharacterized protein n=1 Tax=Hymenochirus boettgeri TaxID=247094 RepID=A0A8T2JL27_9PIPI|nr:hypothetical protein GDO86_013728 [Hymenochirus boettgeri]
MTSVSLSPVWEVRVEGLIHIQRTANGFVIRNLSEMGSYPREGNKKLTLKYFFPDLRSKLPIPLVIELWPKDPVYCRLQGSPVCDIFLLESFAVLDFVYSYLTACENKNINIFAWNWIFLNDDEKPTNHRSGRFR